jgi:hypothetical protein
VLHTSNQRELFAADWDRRCALQTGIVRQAHHCIVVDAVSTWAVGLIMTVRVEVAVLLTLSVATVVDAFADCVLDGAGAETMMVRVATAPARPHGPRTEWKISTTLRRRSIASKTGALIIECSGVMRLLLKRFAGAPNSVQSDGKYEYWSVPIGQANQYCSIDLVEIAVGPDGDRKQVQHAIKGTAFEKVPLI